MNNQDQPLSPCPECGGARAWFQYQTDHGDIVDLHVGFGKGARLYACTCLACGATTLRPAPEMMEQIRQWGQTQKPFALKS